ncbi:MAG TPA: hypothetical protein VMI06_02645 [Terriglobia bacterium]|nr:hypothetical protein [Terriglobia bacterium]
MALYKDLKIGEHKKFEFTNEFFNIINHTKFSGVSAFTALKMLTIISGFPELSQAADRKFQLATARDPQEEADPVETALSDGICVALPASRASKRPNPHVPPPPITC